GRPLTVKELAQEAKRRGFKSSSHDFPRMLAVRAREMKLDGVLKRAVGQPGFVLAQPSQGTTKGLGQASRSDQLATKKSVTTGGTGARGKAAKPGKRVSLREVLTQILKKSTKPMTGSELAAQALASGYQTSSKSFVDVVWVAMTNMKNVE